MTEPREDRLGVTIGLVVLRLGAGGLLFLGHGLPKLLDYNTRASRFADPIGLGPELGFALVVFTETVCSLLVAFGVFTRFTVIPPLVFFAIAGLIHHADDPWNRRELAFLFAVPFLALLFAGAGRWSFDGWWRERWRKRVGSPTAC
jgi:putative oxidoreductase